MKILFSLTSLLLMGGIQANLRALQTGPTPAPTDAAFRASYVGQYQALFDPLCSGPAQPVVRAACRGDVRITGTSDESIQCGTVAQTDDEGFNYIECVNTCVDTACEEVYLLRSVTSNSIDGIYADIFFDCTGDTVESTQAVFSFEDVGDGNCVAGTLGSLGSRAFNFARLGVDCPEGFVFDDTFFECNLGSGSTQLELESGQDYTCFDGDNCQGEQCDIDFDRIVVTAELPSFFNTCVDSLKGLPLALAPTPTPVRTPTVHAFFQVWWAILFDGSCSGKSPSIQIECTNGVIGLVGIDSDTVSCSKSGDSILECTDSGTSFVNQFTAVRYTCEGTAGLPETTITYPEQVAFCDNNALETTVQHGLQLGIECELSDGPTYVHIDYYVECGGRSHEFDILDEFGESGSRYTCLEEATFPARSLPSDVKTIAELSISTDETWRTSGFSFCFSRGPAPTPAPVATPTPPPMTSTVTAKPGGSGPTSPPTDAAFRASYVGQYQALFDLQCFGPAQPVVRAACRGDVRITGTSDKSIQCGTIAQTDDEGFNYIDCVNTCSGSMCEDVYLLRSRTSNSIDGIYADIFFDCSGDTVESTQAVFSFEDVGDGNCVAGTLGSRAFHYARLGVDCPEGFVFDDTFFECNLQSRSTQVELESGQDYTCIDGDNCQGEQCDIDFERIVVAAELPSFFDTCVGSLKGLPLALAPTPSPARTPTVHAFFQVWWAILFDGLGGRSCNGNTPTIQIECTNGVIGLWGIDADTVSCSKSGDSILECTDSGTSFVNQFTAVRYTCSGNTGLPETTITYPEQEAFCDNNALETTVQHGLQLGIECELSDGPTYVHIDYYVECGGRSHEFDILDEFGESGNRYTCLEEATFPARSLPSDVKTIAELSISTDETWRTSGFSFCFNRGPPPVSGPPTSSPTRVPVAPVAGPTPAPVVVPTNAPVTQPPGLDPPVSQEKSVETPVNQSSESKSNVGPIVGGAVGAVAFICLAALLALFINRRKREGQPAKDPFYYEEDQAPRPQDHTGSHTDEYSENTGYPSSPPQSPAGYRGRYVEDMPPSPRSPGSQRSHQYPEDDYPHAPRSGSYQYDDAYPTEPAPNRGYADDDYPPVASPTPRGSTSSSAGVGVPVMPVGGLQTKDQVMSVIEGEPEPVVRARLAPAVTGFDSRGSGGSGRVSKDPSGISGDF